MHTLDVKVLRSYLCLDMNPSRPSRVPFAGACVTRSFKVFSRVIDVGVGVALAKQFVKGMNEEKRQKFILAH